MWKFRAIFIGLKLLNFTLFFTQINIGECFKCEIQPWNINWVIWTVLYKNDFNVNNSFFKNIVDKYSKMSLICSSCTNTLSVPLLILLF
jgi:hypothetical protein